MKYSIYIILVIVLFFIFYNINEYYNSCSINLCNTGFIVYNDGNKDICINYIYNFTTCGATGRLGPTLT